MNLGRGVFLESARLEGLPFRQEPFSGPCDLFLFFCDPRLAGFEPVLWTEPRLASSAHGFMTVDAAGADFQPPKKYPSRSLLDGLEMSHQSAIVVE